MKNAYRPALLDLHTEVLYKVSLCHYNLLGRSSQYDSLWHNNECCRKVNITSHVQNETTAVVILTILQQQQNLVEMTKTQCTNCIAPSFCILDNTCFGSSLPSSGSFLDLSKLLEIQMEWVVYYIVNGYVTCVHTGHVTTHYMI
jgi:hypothetical protein